MDGTGHVTSALLAYWSRPSVSCCAALPQRACVCSTRHVTTCMCQCEYQASETNTHTDNQMRKADSSFVASQGAQRVKALKPRRGRRGREKRKSCRAASVGLQSNSDVEDNVVQRMLASATLSKHVLVGDKTKCARTVTYSYMFTTRRQHERHTHSAHQTEIQSLARAHASLFLSIRNYHSFLANVILWMERAT